MAWLGRVAGPDPTVSTAISLCDKTKKAQGLPRWSTLPNEWHQEKKNGI